MSRARRILLAYFLIVVATSTAIAACIPRLRAIAVLLVNVTMFAPGLVSIVFRLWFREGLRSVGWSLRPSRYWILALLFPATVLILSTSASLWLGLASFGAPPGPGLIWKLPMFSLLSVPFALGEELGWRGYAQGKLIDEFGVLKGFLILGVVWGFWHSPAFYFLGSFPNHPFLGPFVMTPIDNILVVVPLGWLYIRSRNIWIPTIAHAFGDVLWGYSDVMISQHAELGSWAILQVVQLVITIVCLIDLRRISPVRPAYENQALHVATSD